MDTNTQVELRSFLDEWNSDPNGCRQIFTDLKSYLEQKNDIEFDFVSRPGVTYSLRAARSGQDRPLFVLIDVIDEDPRWLSVCFYGDMITDPQEYGDLVPEGLMGEDGYCFDVDENDQALVGYICKRLDEAYESTSS
ncbi:MAG: hypothetical protein KGY38_04250 [Desulfobacterales bacterium]|nr:hypothetical protein [Desulfobacterales bacterium]